MIFDPGQLELKGGDVWLRPMIANDAAALAAAGKSRDTYEFTTVPDVSDSGAKYVERALSMRTAGTRFPFTLLWQGRIVGSTSYMRYQPWTWPAGSANQRSNRPDIVEIGYTWLAASAQRTACNTQAKLLLLEQAFDRWQVHAVLLRTDERNARSRAAIERLGAKFEGILRADMPAFDGGVRNTAQYSIVTSEWPNVRTSLQRKLTSHQQ